MTQFGLERPVSAGGSILLRHTGNQTTLYTPSEEVASGGYLALIVGYDPINVYDPGCMCHDMDHADCIPVPPRPVLHPFRYRYSFIEVALTHVCLNQKGERMTGTLGEGEANPCDTDDKGDFVYNRDVMYEIIREEDGGRVGVLDFPREDHNYSRTWAINERELTHKWPPPRDAITCADDESEPYVIYDIDIHNGSYGGQFSPVPPGTHSVADRHDIQGPGSTDFVVPVWIREKTDRNGRLVRSFGYPGQHMGIC